MRTTGTIKEKFQILPRELKLLFELMEVKKLFFVIQGGASFLIALFEGISLGLLVPLARGVIEKNFTFLKTANFFGLTNVAFSQWVDKAPNALLFFMLVFLIFSAAAAKNGLDYFFKIYISSQRERYAFNLRKKIFARHLTFGKLYFDRTSQDYITRTFQFVEEIMSTIDAIAYFLTESFTLAVYFAGFERRLAPDYRENQENRQGSYSYKHAIEPGSIQYDFMYDPDKSLWPGK